jgi:hypothetical protein
MMKFVQMCVVALMVGLLVPAFALDTTHFAKVLTTAVQADEYLYSMMEPGTPRHSPEFQAALATQKKARIAIGNEINALTDAADLQEALVVAKKFSVQTGYSREIGRLAEALIAERLKFVSAHQD